MINKILKNMKPLHIVIAVAIVFFVLLIVTVLVKTINFNNFIINTENKTFDSRQVLLVNNKVKKPNKDIVIITIDDASYEYLTNK